MQNAVLFFSLASTAAAQDAIRAVWAVNDGEKIARDDLANPNKVDNSAWDGSKVRLFGARNEIVSFQLVVESGEEGVTGLSVSLPVLRQRDGDTAISYVPPADDPTDYVGRPVQLFPVNYMLITEPTTASWIYVPGSPGAPANPTGWKPVQLAPENAKPGRGGLPLTVEPRLNQLFWFDIYIGRELPRGVYDGVIEARAGNEVRSIPVELEVLGFTLPDENSMNAMVYYETSQPVLYMGRNMDARFHRFAHRQRIELVHAYDLALAEANIDRFNGRAFSAGNAYAGPGESVGNRIAPASFYGPGAGYDDRSSAWRRSDEWINYLERAVPGALTFLYMPDEPPPAEFPRIRAIAENIHSNPGPGQRLPIFVTRGYTPDLDGSIDIWCSGPRAYDIARAIEERANGRDYWVYNGGRPAGPAIVIDSPATDPRAAIWACFKHGIKTYFYWHSVHWRHNSQKQGERNQNVWANSITYDNRSPGRGGAYAHGDGVLIYPGEEILHPDEDRGIAGPISTVQLANFRRGLQDHLYLTMARNLGLNDLVEEALEELVPRVFSAAGARVGFSESGNAYEGVRWRLGRAIEEAQRGK